MIALLSTAFLMGFLGSLHCIGMCGGLVTSLSMSRPRIWWAGLMGYQFGRVATYTLLGLIAGMLGLAATKSPIFSDVQQALTIFAGLLIIYFGLNLAGWLADPLVKAVSVLGNMIGLTRMIQAASSSRMPMSWFMVGMFNGLLPCGLVYAALAMSMTAGHLALSAAMMLAFGLGTIPAMSFVPSLMQAISPARRGMVLKVAAVLLIVIGLTTMVRGGQWMHAMMGHDHHAHHEQPMDMNMDDMKMNMPSMPMRP